MWSWEVKEFLGKISITAGAGQAHETGGPTRAISPIITTPCAWPSFGSIPPDQGSESPWPLLSLGAGSSCSSALMADWKNVLSVWKVRHWLSPEAPSSQHSLSLWLALMKQVGQAAEATWQGVEGGLWLTTGWKLRLSAQQLTKDQCSAKRWKGWTWTLPSSSLQMRPQPWVTLWCQWRGDPGTASPARLSWTTDNINRVSQCEFSWDVGFCLLGAADK